VFDGLSDILKIAALILAILLPAIGGIFQYRREERKAAAAASNPTIGTAGLIAVGGAIASKEGAQLYVEEFQRATAAIDRLTEATHRRADEDAKLVRAINNASEGAERLMSTVIDDLRKMRLALEELAQRRR
jgi:hypothetical protein